MTAEGASCAARAVPSRKACRPRGPRCFPADRFPDGVPASGESPAPRSYQSNQRAKHLRENTTTRPFEKASRRVRTPSRRLLDSHSLFFQKVTHGPLGPTGGNSRAGWGTPGQLAGPTRRQGRQLARSSGPTGGRLASPTRPLPFGEATSPSATRPRELPPPWLTHPRATTAWRATSCAVPS